MKKLRLALLTIVLSALILSGALIPHVAALGVIEPGFPIMVTTTGGGEPSGPGMNVLAANIDADPALEIVLPIQTGGPLAAWNADASPVSGWPVEGPTVMGMSAAGNLNQTLPGMEVVTLYALHYTTTAEVYAYSTFGDVLPGFPITLPSTVTTAPILVDVDGNGLDEIFVGANNGNVYAYDAGGAPLAGWPLSLPGENAGAPVIVDLDGSGDLEMVVTYSDPGLLPTGYLTVLRFSDQTPLAGFPVSFRRDQFTTPFPVVGDVDGDSQLEVVVAAEATPTFYPIIRVYSRSGALESEMRHPDLFIQTSSAPALADLNGDSVPEILALSRYGVSVWYGNGTPFPGWPVWSGDGIRNSTPVVGDVNGDNVPEVVVATQRAGDCEGGNLWIFDRNGQSLPNFPMYFPISHTGVPAIADIDLDGRNEIVITSSVRCNSYTVTAPKVWAFDLGGATSGAIQWGQFNNGPRHRGVYTPPPTFVDLALSMSDSPDPTIATSTTTYTLTVTNAGSGMAHDVQVNDTLPSGATLIQALPSQGSCTTVNGIVTCGLGDMPNVATATVALTINYPFEGTITNSASVAAAENESSLANNVASQSTTVLPGARLSLNMTTNASRYTYGSTVIYTLTVSNISSSEASSIAINDMLPNKLTYVSDTPSQGSYNPISGLWSVGALASGQTATLTLTATVNSGVGTTAIDNTAQVTNLQPSDPNSINTSVTARIFVDVADIGVTLTVDKTTPVESGLVIFTVTARNNGSGTATGVSLDTPLPAGISYISSSAGKGTYSSATGVWTIGTIIPEESFVLTLAGRVNTGTFGQTITHQASIRSSDQADPVSSNNQRTVSLLINGVDLQVSASLSQSNGTEGSAVTYNITVANVGANTATSVVVTPALPAGVTYSSHMTANGTYNSGMGTWQVNSIPPGSSVFLSITATVNAGTGGQTLDFNSAISQISQPDTNPANNTVTHPFTVQSANLRVGMTGTNLVPKEGNAVSFTMGVDNLGPYSVTGVVVNDLLPAGLTYVSHSTNQGTYTPATGDWAVGSLSPGQMFVLTINATVDSGTTDMVITNTAQITASSLPDPVSTNNSASVTLGVGGVDVVLTLSVDRPNPNEGENIVYTITADTVGSDPATNVVVEDILPEGLSYVSSTASDGSYDSGTGRWTIPTIPGVGTVTLQITASVNLGMTGSTIVNTARVISSNQYDPNSANSTKSVSVTISFVDLALMLAVSKANPGEGENIVYTLTADTIGNDPATNVVVEDILPAGLTYVSSAASVGSYDSGAGRWTIPAIPGVGTVTLQITASVNAGTTGNVITNTAQVIASDHYDPNSNNDTSSVSITVGLTDLALTMTVDDITPDPGANITYTLTIVNNATYPVTGVTVTDVLPNGLTFVSASGNYDSETGVWTIGTLNGGASTLLNLTVTVDSESYGARIDNTATLTSNHPDPNPGNNTRLVTINVNVVNLSVSITDSADTVYLEGAFSYTVTVTNLGTLPATGVILTNTLSTDVTLVSTTATQGSGCTHSALVVTCDLGALAIGGSAQVTINVTANAGFTGRTSFVAVVSADQPEIAITNNTDTETTGVTNLIVNATNDVDDSVCSASHCSLREAVLAANALPGLDTIRFNIPGPGPHTIEPDALLPVMTSPVVLDGFSEPDYRGAPMIVLSGTKLSYTNTSNYGLHITAGGSTVRGFVLHRWGGNAIYIVTNGGNVIQGNYIGTQTDGLNGYGNRQNGVYLGAPNNTIGGTSPNARNVIGGNQYWAIYAAAPGNTIQGNYVGVKADGSGGLTNFNGGVYLGNDNNLFGGTEPGARNIVSFTQANPALQVWGQNNIVQGNFIGTDPTGTQILRNYGDGIEVRSSNNLIGGTAPGAGNLIVGSVSGIHINTSSSPNPVNTIVQGNLIGTDWTGTQPLGIGTGILVEASSNLIGGTTPGARNIIAASDGNGIDIIGLNNIVQGNYIGTNAAGTAAIANDDNGIRVRGSGNVIGGTTPEARNLISGNNLAGVYLYQNNSYNTRDNLIQGNYIGTDVSGTNPLGNGGYGFRVSTGFDNNAFYPNFIGGTEPGASNRVAYNTGGGIQVNASYAAVSILSNEIYDNAGLGINLGSDAVTPNDAGDADLGPNRLQNFPVITNAIYDGSTLTITGTLDSTLSTDFRVEFFSNQACDPLGYGEGQRFVGATTVSVGSSPATFTASFNDVTLLGQYISATATHPNNQTSEFSECIGLDGADLSLAMSASRAAVNENDAVSYTVTLANLGPGAATGIQVQALLPAGLTYQSDDSAGTYTPGSGEWAVGTLAKNASATLTINAVVDVGTVGSIITFPVTIAAVGEVDLNPANNQASAALSVGIADLDLLSEVDSIGPNEGDTITYYTVIANTGPSDATGIVVSSPLPAGVTFVDKLMTQGSYDETTGEWLVGSLDNGDEASLTVIVTVDAGMQGSTLTNTATITATDQADPNAANNTDGKSVPVGFADIGVQSMVDNAMPGSGEPINMTVIVSNGGPSDATNLVIESPLPAGVDLDAASATTGVYSEAESRWTVAGLSRGNQAVLTLAGTVSAGAGGNTLSSTARVIQLGQIDLNTANDTASVQLNVEPETDLAITSAFNPSSAIPSATVTLTITVSNSGPMTADDVTVQDVLPVGLDFVSASADRGLYDRFIGVWSVGSLGVSETATLTITVTIPAGAPVGTISNTASIQSASIADQNLSNNTMTSNLTVQAIPSVPILLLPANGASTTSRQPAFTWNPAPDAVGYELQLGIGNPPSSTVFSGSATRYTPPAPLLMTTYYWRVRSVNAGGNFSAWSAVRGVIITSPSSAAPGRNLFTTSTPTLTWGRVSWSTGYEIQIDNNSSFASPEYSSGLIPADTLSHTLTSPLPNGVWYWRARARRSDGAWGPWSTADSFVIAAQ